MPETQEYKLISTILEENGYDLEIWSEVAKVLQWMRGKSWYENVFIIVILRRLFDIETDFIKNDDMSDDDMRNLYIKDVLREKKEKERNNTSNKEQKMKIGTFAVRAGKAVDKFFTPPFVPSQAKNKRLQEYVVRVSKKSQTFESLQQLLMWVCFTVRNKYVDDVFNEAYARLINNETDKKTAMLAMYYKGEYCTDKYLHRMAVNFPEDDHFVYLYTEINRIMTKQNNDQREKKFEYDLDKPELI